jgi:hypothetical protein
MRWNRVAMGLVLTVLGAMPAVSLGDGATAASTTGTGLWNVDMMMKQAAENIARRYNLNEEQRHYTYKLLADRLGIHPDRWPLAIRLRMRMVWSEFDHRLRWLLAGLRK